MIYRLASSLLHALILQKSFWSAWKRKSDSLPCLVFQHLKKIALYLTHCQRSRLQRAPAYDLLCTIANHLHLHETDWLQAFIVDCRFWTTIKTSHMHQEAGGITIEFPSQSMTNLSAVNFFLGEQKHQTISCSNLLYSLKDAVDL